MHTLTPLSPQRFDPGVPCHLMPETTGYAGVNNKVIAE